MLLVERAELTSGSTFHSAGLVGQLRADPALTRMNAWSADLYRRLEEAGGDLAPGWVESGSLRLASSPQRMEEIRRQAAWARRAGLPLELVSAEEARALFPLMSTDGVLGAAYTPTDGQVDPARLCTALAAMARSGGATIAQRTRVTAVDTTRDASGRERVTRVRTDRGDVECEVVVDCGGMFGAEIARLVGVRVPIVPMSHQYVVTEPFLPAGTGPLPSLRDPDLLVYYRQELDGLVMGGYERQSAPWTATARSFDAVPADFNGKLLEPDWDRFAEIVENAQVRVPVLGDTGVRSMINGPEAFTPGQRVLPRPDRGGGVLRRRRILRPRHRRSRRHRAGDGRVDPRRRPRSRPVAHGRAPLRPGVPLTRLHPRPRGRELRELLRHPHARQPAGSRSPPEGVAGLRLARRARCGVRREGRLGAGGVLRRQRGRRGRTSCGRAAGRATAGRRGSRRSTGPRARPSRCSTSRRSARSRSPGRTRRRSSRMRSPAMSTRAPGAVVYTQALDDRGGVAMDVTVTRLAARRVPRRHRHRVRPPRPGLAPRADPAELEQALRRPDRRRHRCLGLLRGVGPAGPRSTRPAHSGRPVERRVPVPDDAGDDRRRRPGPRPAGHVRRGAGLGALLSDRVRGRALAGAGGGRGAARAAARGLPGHREPAPGEGLPRVGRRRRPDTTPDEAGVAFAVRRGGGYAGAEARDKALAQARADGTARRLRCLVLADPRTVALGGEPVRADPDGVLGFVTSGGLRLHRRALDRLRAAAPGVPARRGGGGRGGRAVGRRGGRPRAAVRPGGEADPGVAGYPKSAGGV